MMVPLLKLFVPNAFLIKFWLLIFALIEFLVNIFSHLSLGDLECFRIVLNGLSPRIVITILAAFLDIL